jgi:hypothetical protein
MELAQTIDHPFTATCIDEDCVRVEGFDLRGEADVRLELLLRQDGEGSLSPHGAGG